MSDRFSKLERLLAADPHDAFVLYALAQEYAKAGDSAKAVAHFDRCLAADSTYHYAYYHKARVLQSTGDLPGALVIANTGLAAAQRAGDAKALNELLALATELAGGE